MGSERPRGCLLASSLLHIIDFFFKKKRTLSPALLPAPFHLPITPSPPTGGRAALEDGGQGRGSSARGPGRARGGGEGREAQGHPAQAHNAAQAAGLLVTWGEGTGGTRGSREVSGGDKSFSDGAIRGRGIVCDKEASSVPAVATPASGSDWALVFWRHGWLVDGRAVLMGQCGCCRVSIGTGVYCPVGFNHLFLSQWAGLTRGWQRRQSHDSQAPSTTPEQPGVCVGSRWVGPGHIHPHGRRGDGRRWAYATAAVVGVWWGWRRGVRLAVVG